MTTDTRTRVRAGDPDAFAELFDTYARGLFKVGTVTFTSAITQRAVVDGNKQMPAEHQAG
ncbi:hypothetical protein [Streptomyces botrytidirepellens]|uniref:Uncharacterized protein n=1 Tax=Streptomyces botrytidirepellens TaxID=2486417 RepID=A0A3M8WCB7_9ACTN|nr:hypothetical protein [Streptomyces botrytidirepellens]RNG27474.1 hypothetical protein EEJ42_13315 [Streptomyces botrytidirepellens]